MFRAMHIIFIPPQPHHDIVAPPANAPHVAQPPQQSFRRILTAIWRLFCRRREQ